MTDTPSRANGFDAVDLDMIKRGDMLGSKLGERVFEALSRPHRTPTPEIDGLIRRLREWTGRYEEGSFDTEEALMSEAAAELAKLLAHISALEERLAATERERDDAREYAKEARILGTKAEDKRIHEQHRASIAEARAEKAEERLVRAREVVRMLSCIDLDHFTEHDQLLLETSVTLAAQLHKEISNDEA